VDLSALGPGLSRFFSLRVTSFWKDAFFFFLTKALSCGHMGLFSYPCTGVAFQTMDIEAIDPFIIDFRLLSLFSSEKFLFPSSFLYLMTERLVVFLPGVSHEGCAIL